MPPRILGRVRSQPRVHARLADAIGGVLVDQAYITRRIRGGGTVSGQPRFAQSSWGPYAALLSNPTWAERRDADRYETDVTHTLAIASDVQPKPSDLIDVLAGDNDSATATINDMATVRYRVLDVQQRRTAYGATLIYHLQLTKLEED